MLKLFHTNNRGKIPRKISFLTISKLLIICSILGLFFSPYVNGFNSINLGEPLDDDETIPPEVEEDTECIIRDFLKGMMQDNLANDKKREPLIKYIASKIDGKSVCTENNNIGDRKLCSKKGDTKLVCSEDEYEKLVKKFFDSRLCYADLALTGAILAPYLTKGSKIGMIDKFMAKYDAATPVIDNTLLGIYATFTYILTEYKTLLTSTLEAFSSDQLNNVWMKRKDMVLGVLCSAADGNNSPIAKDAVLSENMAIIKGNFGGLVDEAVYAYTQAYKSIANYAEVMLVEGGIVDRLLAAHKEFHAYRMSKMTEILVSQSSFEAILRHSKYKLDFLPNFKIKQSKHRGNHKRKQPQASLLEFGNDQVQGIPALFPGYVYSNVVNTIPINAFPYQNQTPYANNYQPSHQQYPESFSAVQQQKLQFGVPMHYIEQKTNSANNFLPSDDNLINNISQISSDNNKPVDPENKLVKSAINSNTNDDEQNKDTKENTKTDEDKVKNKKKAKSETDENSDKDNSKSDKTESNKNETDTTKDDKSDSNASESKPDENDSKQKDNYENGNQKDKSYVKALDYTNAPVHIHNFNSTMTFKGSFVGKLDDMDIFISKNGSLTTELDETAVAKMVQSGIFDITDNNWVLKLSLAPQAALLSHWQMIYELLADPKIDLEIYYNKTMNADGSITDGIKNTPNLFDEKSFAESVSRISDLIYQKSNSDELYKFDNLIAEGHFTVPKINGIINKNKNKEDSLDKEKKNNDKSSEKNTDTKDDEKLSSFINIPKVYKVSDNKNIPDATMLKVHHKYNLRDIKSADKPQSFITQKDTDKGSYNIGITDSDSSTDLYQLSVNYVDEKAKEANPLHPNAGFPMFAISSLVLAISCWFSIFLFL